MIPDGWVEAELGDHATFLKGSGLSKSDLVQYGSELCIHYGELFTKYGPVIDKVESRCEVISGACRSKCGDVLMPGSDVTPRGLATASAVMVEGVVLGGDVIVIRPTASTLWGPYLSYTIRKSKESVLRLVKGSTVYHIHAKDLSGLKIQLPPVAEQRAITEVLADADMLVESLDALIAKKRDMKQAAMQQLLTGRTRLPGYEDEWTFRQVGDCLTIEHGRNQSQIVDPAGQYPILATGGEIGRTNTFLHNGPSVLIGRKGTIDRPQYMATPFWTVDTLFYSRIRNGYNAKFLYFKFLMVDWRSLNEASGVPSLNASTIERVEMSIPKFNEQQAIAEVLSDIDTEIEALVAQREKVELVKLGMMQELLSGRVRLV